MPRLPAWLERYGLLPKAVFQFVIGQFLINLVNTSQFLLLNLYLKGKGLEDPAIAALTSQRFVAALFLAIPAGLWLRGRRLRTPMFWGSVFYPLTALASIEAVNAGKLELASWGFLAMGFSGLVLNVASLPMALRLVPPKHTSEALSLLASTWAAAIICGGVLSSVLQGVGTIDFGGHQVVFDEHATLWVLTLAGFGAPFFYAALPDSLPRNAHGGHWLHVRREDWRVLVRALTPTLCIATGAGLSIQFLNLFFSQVHHLSAAAFSGYSSVSNVLVLFAGLVVPEVKRRLGWRGVILGVQMMAVVLLAIMGLTELWNTAVWALPVALVCFILRQPLMNMTGPATNELTMSYVGEGNRELVSACNGAIWSGAWWLAARTFEVLRANDLPYWQVFLTTFVLYIFGTLSYLRLIRTVERRAATVPSSTSLHETGPM